MVTTSATQEFRGNIFSEHIRFQSVTHRKRKTLKIVQKLMVLYLNRFKT